MKIKIIQIYRDRGVDYISKNRVVEIAKPKNFCQHESELFAERLKFEINITNGTFHDVKPLNKQRNCIILPSKMNDWEID